uniref:class I SAM-dependent methyltransferase n=2 Tax=Yoonia sp. TaxID=2212373 RepID=UPI0040482873
MSHSRISTAVEDGLLVLPAGQITLMRPPGDYDVGALARDRVLISQGYYPDFARWSDAGYSVTARPEPATVAIVVVPRSKTLARSMVAQAASWAQLVVVDGQRTDGVDGLFKDCRKRIGDIASIPKGHGRIFWFDGTDAFADWIAPPPAKGPHGYFTTAGVFSDGAVDKGSALLAQSLPDKLPARLADLGAGWGYLAAPALSRSGVKSLDLIEAEALSLDCARLNVTDPRVTFHWADATTFTPQTAYDGIVMNPPFHTGRAAEPQLGRAFIASAARVLASHGKLWMVANRHLPYEQALRDHFRNVEEIAGSSAFKVFHATRPIR